MIRPQTAHLSHITFNYCKIGQSPNHSVQGMQWYCPSSYRADYVTFAYCTFATGLASATGEQTVGEAIWNAGGDYMVAHDRTFTGWAHSIIDIIPSGEVSPRSISTSTTTPSRVTLQPTAGPSPFRPRTMTCNCTGESSLRQHHRRPAHKRAVGGELRRVHRQRHPGPGTAVILVGC